MTDLLRPSSSVVNNRGISVASSDIVLVPSTQGKFFMVDAEDEERVRAIKWSAAWLRSNWYAVNWNGGRTLYLHRFVMNATKGQIYDHENGDTLNCCKWNLRLATKQQNDCNRRPCGAIPFKGVVARGSKFQARIKINKKQVNLGYFATAEMAALAYDAAARDAHGAFARLNFKEGL